MEGGAINFVTLWRFQHVENPGVVCSVCQKYCPNKKSFRNHFYKNHREKALM